MIVILTTALVLAGCAFCLLASIGIVRMPDLYMRMHASTKAGSLGVGLLALGLVAHFQETDVVARAVCLIVFLFITAPVASHLIGRAAYLRGVPHWEGVVRDDFRDYLEERDADASSGKGRPAGSLTDSGASSDSSTLP